MCPTPQQPSSNLQARKPQKKVRAESSLLLYFSYEIFINIFYYQFFFVTLQDKVNSVELQIT